VIILSNKAKVLIITGKLDNKIGVIGDTNYLRKLGLGTGRPKQVFHLIH